jgi:hypothetical protein
VQEGISRTEKPNDFVANKMILNGVKSINPEQGDYMVLSDLGHDGLRVSFQAKTPQELIDWCSKTGLGNPMSFVKLVHLNIAEMR